MPAVTFQEYSRHPSVKRSMRRRCHSLFTIAAMAFAVIGVVIAKERERANPVEVGKVEWGRDLDAALASSAKSGKPVLVLFQEVPG